MIEIRWLKYKSNMNPDTGEYFYAPCYVAKLQYRKDTILTDHTGRKHSGNWSDWIDVPTVTEEDGVV